MRNKPTPLLRIALHIATAERVRQGWIPGALPFPRQVAWTRIAAIGAVNNIPGHINIQPVLETKQQWGKTIEATYAKFWERPANFSPLWKSPMKYASWEFMNG